MVQNELKKERCKRENPAGNYIFKAKNSNTRTRYEICTKLKIKTPERCFCVSIVNFEQVITGW